MQKTTVSSAASTSYGEALRPSAGRHQIANIVIKVNGQWFFPKRTIFNGASARWQYKGDRNPYGLQEAATVVMDVTSRCGVPGSPSGRHSDFPAT